MPSNGGIIGPANDPINSTTPAASVETFTSNGTYTATGVPAAAQPAMTADVLIISGGRGGVTNNAPGGGGGNYLFTPNHPIPGSAVPVTIGGGGGAGGIGTASTFGAASPLAAPGGTPPVTNDGSGTYTAGTSTTGGGAGGAGAGGNGPPGPSGRPGGPGAASPPIDSTNRAGGGGGGGHGSTGKPAGTGVDGGGNGGTTPSDSPTPGQAGTANTGGGGGGGSAFSGTGGGGGSGVVLVKRNAVTLVSASGVWSMQDVLKYENEGTWPT